MIKTSKIHNNYSFNELGSVLWIYISALVMFAVQCPDQIAAANSDKLLPNMFNFMALASMTCIVTRWYRGTISLNINKSRQFYSLIPLLPTYLLIKFVPSLALVSLILYVLISMWMLGRDILQKYWPAMIFIALSAGISPAVSQPVIIALTKVVKYFGLFFARTFISPAYHLSGNVILQEGINSNLSHQIGIAEECSGWRSLVGCLLFAYICGANAYLKASYCLMLVYISIALAIIGNMSRVAISISAIHFGWNNIASPDGHHMLGTCVMLINMGLIFYLTNLFLKFMHKKVALNS